MTTQQSQARPEMMPTGGGRVSDRVMRPRAIQRSTLLEIGGAACAAFALVWITFKVAGLTGPLGFGVCTLAAFLMLYGVLCWRLYGALSMKDRLATLAIWSGALVAFVPLVAVILFVVIQGGSVVFADFPHFLISDFANAGGSVTQVGAGAAIVGTVEQVGLATIFTVPLGILTATYLVNNRNAYSRLVSLVVDAMTGSPAIIAGLFIYLIWVVPKKEAGHTGFAAALALSVMMLPIVTRTSQEVLAIVPNSLKEAALALGAPRWRSILRVTLPTARVGLVTAVILGVARVAGETAPVFLTAGGFQKYNWNPFSGEQDDLPLRIYEMIGQGSVNSIREAWGVSFVLVLVVLTLFLLARLIGSKSSGPSRWSVLFRTRRPAQEVAE
jgi:phosphate transport system permease protein